MLRIGLCDFSSVYWFGFTSIGPSFKRIHFLSFITFRIFLIFRALVVAINRCALATIIMPNKSEFVLLKKVSL